MPRDQHPSWHRRDRQQRHQHNDPTILERMRKLEHRQKKEPPCAKRIPQTDLSLSERYIDSRSCCFQVNQSTTPYRTTRPYQNLLAKPASGGMLWMRGWDGQPRIVTCTSITSAQMPSSTTHLSTARATPGSSSHCSNVSANAIVPQNKATMWLNSILKK